MPKRKPTNPQTLPILTEEQALERQRERRRERDRLRQEQSASQLIRSILGDELADELPEYYESTEIIEQPKENGDDGDGEEEIELEIYQAPASRYDRIVDWMRDFGMRLMTARDDWYRHPVGHMHVRFSGPPGTMERLCGHRWFREYVFNVSCRDRDHPGMATMAMAERKRRGGACTCRKCNLRREELGHAPLYELDGSEYPENC